MLCGFVSQLFVTYKLLYSRNKIFETKSEKKFEETDFQLPLKSKSV
jgi:hypothetical protein